MSKKIIITESQLQMLITEMTAREISQAVKDVNKDPSDAQKKAGNYKMGHITVAGYDITIENPRGSYRRGKDKNGKPWEVKMVNHYGYFTKTVGKDGDHIDVFVGRKLDFDTVYVVDQVNLKGEFDESKVMFGFGSEKEAKDAYFASYTKGWKGFKKITAVSLDFFKEWLYDGRRQRIPFYQYIDVKAETKKLKN